MERVITSISFDLKFNVLDTHPTISVAFTDIAPGGQESHGRVTLQDAAAGELWKSAGGAAMLDAVNAALDTKRDALPDLPTIAARMTAVDDLDRQIREKQATVDSALKAKDEADKAAREVDAAIADKRSELASMDKAIRERAELLDARPEGSAAP